MVAFFSFYDYYISRLQQSLLFFLVYTLCRPSLLAASFFSLSLFLSAQFINMYIYKCVSISILCTEPYYHSSL